MRQASVRRKRRVAGLRKLGGAFHNLAGLSWAFIVRLATMVGHADKNALEIIWNNYRQARVGGRHPSNFRHTRGLWRVSIRNKSKIAKVSRMAKADRFTIKPVGNDKDDGFPFPAFARASSRGINNSMGSLYDMTRD